MSFVFGIDFLIGFEPLLGWSWALLGRSWVALGSLLGRSWVGLGVVLEGSLAILGSK